MRYYPINGVGRLFCCVFLMTFSMRVSSEEKQCAIKKSIGAHGENGYVITHPNYVLEVFPKEGGRGCLTIGDNVKLRPMGKRKVALFREYFNEKQMEGEGNQLAFSVEIDKKVNGTTIILRTVLDAKTAGADLDGVELVRKITCRGNVPYIQVVDIFRNKTKEPRYLSYGIRNDFTITPFGDEYRYLPTTRNIQEISKILRIKGYYVKGAWERNPVEGWVGVNDPKSKLGLVFVMNYDHVSCFLTPSGGGVGWMVDGGELSPGGTFSSEYIVVPVKGMSGFTYASKSLIADTKVTPLKKRVQIDQSVLSLRGNMAIKLATSVYEIRGKRTRKLPDVNLVAEQMKVVSRQIFLPGAFTEPIVVKTVAGAKDAGPWKYETFYEGNFYAQPIPFAELASEYMREAPVKAKKESASSLTSSSFKITSERNALVFFGFYTQWYGLKKALHGWNLKFSDGSPKRCSFIPGASELKNYSIIYLSDIAAASLPNSFQVALERYVWNGGNLVVLGGPYTYGEGEFEKSVVFSRLMPVISKPFDLKWAKLGKPILVSTTSQSHPIVGKLDVSANPMVYWIHELNLKKSAKTLLTAGKRSPLLVLSGYGRGRVLVFLGAPLGVKKSGQLPFWEWKGWGGLILGAAEWMRAESLDAKKSRIK